MNIHSMINKLQLNKNDFYKYSLIVLILMIAFVSEYSISLNGVLQKILWMILASIGLIWNIQLLRSKHNHKYNYILYCSFIPFIFIAVYTIFLFILNKTSLKISIQATSTTIFLIVDAFMVSFLTMFYKKDSLSIITYALIIGYLISLIFGIFQIGLPALINNFIHGIPDYLEQHDIGVAVVPLLLFYFYLYIKKSENIINHIKIKISLLLFVLLFCGKRSAYMGLIVGIVLIFIIFKLHGPYKRKIIYSFLVLGFISCFFYIYAIHSGFLSTLLENSAFKDRLYVWKWFDNHYWISPTYPGKGFQYIHEYMKAGLGDGMVNSFGYLHNCILQIYIEGGFIGFIIWFGLMLIAIPRFIEKKYNQNVFDLYSILILSTLVIYTVDNVMTYPLYVVSLYISLYGATLISKNVEENSYEY